MAVTHVGPLSLHQSHPGGERDPVDDIAASRPWCPQLLSRIASGVGDAGIRTEHVQPRWPPPPPASGHGMSKPLCSWAMLTACSLLVRVRGDTRRWSAG